MDKPTDIFGIDWDLWSVTYLFPFSGKFKFNYPQVDCVQTKSEVDTVYPGFSVAFAMLESKGCNGSLITSVLKYCILAANGEQLDSYLQSSNTLKAVDIALSIGLSGTELIAFLSDSPSKPSLPGLPDELCFVSTH